MKNWDPKYYDENCVLQYRTAIALLENIRLNGTEVILDIGSGSGKVTHFIAQQVPNGKVVGLDISREMVQFSEQKYKAPNLIFLDKDILNVKYHNRFDIAVSFWTLSWIDNQALALNNIINALKPGGRLLLMYPLRHDAYEVADMMIKQPQWKKYFEKSFAPRPFVTESEYRNIASTITEASISVQKKEIPCVFDSETQMQASVRSWMSYLDCLPSENLKQAFLDEFTENYKSYRKTKDPVMYFSILEICGEKIELKNENNKQQDSASRLKAKL